MAHGLIYGWLRRRVTPALGRFVGCGAATAATEFALVLPVMLTVYLGMVEVGGGVTVDRKLSNLSLTLANLTARAIGPLADSDMNGIFNASSAVLAPYNAANTQMVVTSFVFDSASPPNAYVVWSSASGPGATAMTPSCSTKISTAIVPNNLRTANGSIIFAQAQFPYTPPIGYIATGTLQIKENNFMVPRNVTSVARTNSSGTTYSTCSGTKLAAAGSNGAS